VPHFFTVIPSCRYVAWSSQILCHPIKLTIEQWLQSAGTLSFVSLLYWFWRWRLCCSEMSINLYQIARCWCQKAVLS
jgi:hypothetical protein